MRHMIFSLGLLLLIAGCTGNHTRNSESGKPADEKDNATPTMPVSEFNVNVRLSDAAQKKLVKSKETIIVAGSLTGNPKQGTEQRYLDIKTGLVDLGDIELEVHPGEIATFKNLKLDPGPIARIDSHDPSILISAYSGRKSSKYNLLDCGSYEGNIVQIRGQTIDINCQLIEEAFPRRGN